MIPIHVSYYLVTGRELTFLPGNGKAGEGKGKTQQTGSHGHSSCRSVG